MMKGRSFLLLLALAVGGCSGLTGTNRPVVAKTEHGAYDADAKYCNEKAFEAACIKVLPPLKEAGIIGAADAAGSAAGSAARGFNVGDAVRYSLPFGAAFGLVTGVYNLDQKIKKNVTDCMRGMGWNALLTDD